MLTFFAKRFIFLFGLAAVGFCAHAQAVQLIFEPNTLANLAEIQKAIPESILIETLTHDTNAYIDPKELSYLLGFAEGDRITAEQLARAIDHLQLKHRFEEVHLTISLGVLGHHLHIALRSFWALDRLRIHGWLRGKEKYRALYLIGFGEKFDESKHAHSIKKIQDHLHADGYFNAQVTSEFSHDYHRRTMCVDVTIKKGKQCKIQNVNLEVTGLDAAVPGGAAVAKPTVRSAINKQFLKPLKKRIYNKTVVQDQMRAIKEYLSDAGYLSVELRVHEEVLHADSLVDLNITIELAGKRTIVFFGNHFFSSHQLREMLLAFGRSAWLVPAQILSEEIASAYHKKGFWGATIETHDEDDRYLFVINEGIRVRVGEVILRINSIEQACPAKLAESEDPDKRRGDLLKKKFFSEVLAAQFYDEKLITQALANLRAQYQSDGYPDATIIDCTFQESADAGVYNLVVTLDEGAYRELQDEVVAQGPQAQFGKTIIVGTSTLPFALVHKELCYCEGDVWNPEAVKKTFKRLKELEIFDSIQLHQAAESASSMEKTMVLKLHEDDPYEVRVRAGLELQYVQEYRTFGGLAYKVGGSFLAKNPFNRGDIFRLDTDFASSHFEVVASYRQPWLFSIPLRTMLQAYAIKHDQPGFVGNTNNLYRLTQYGGLINIGRKVEHVDAGVNIGFETMETKLNEPTRLFAIELARALNFDIHLLDKNVPYFLLEPTILVDFVDNNLYPRKGSLTLISAKGMFPLKRSETEAYFVKLLFEQSVYFPAGPVVIALRLRFGHIFHQDFSAIMPSERFYLGGSQSIRSYNADLAPPLGVFCDNKGKEIIVPRGGKSMVNGNAELRIPIHLVLEGVLFQDLGMLSSDNFATFRPGDILAGTGFGVRLKTPIGPLRFDFGFKWKRDVPSQPGWAWSFMFGNAF